MNNNANQSKEDYVSPSFEIIELSTISPLMTSGDVIIGDGGDQEL